MTNKFKKGDMVKLSAEGKDMYSHYFDDSYTDLEVFRVDKTDYKVWQRDKSDHWHVYEYCLEFNTPVEEAPVEEDPKTWKRNKPLFVKFLNSKGKWLRRHFSHIDGVGRVWVFIDGLTSFTGAECHAAKTNKIHEWREPTAEELE